MGMARDGYEKQHKLDTERIISQSKRIDELNNLVSVQNALIDIFINVIKGCPGASIAGRAPGKRLFLSDELRKIIKALCDFGFTQRQTADMLGISAGMVNKALKPCL